MVQPVHALSRGRAARGGLSAADGQMSAVSRLKFRSIYGVDFSGARLAGENIWIARLVRRRRSYELVELSRLRNLCATPDREPALAYLVNRVAASQDALWGMDFPFGLPIEVVSEAASWADQLQWVCQWDGGAYALGEECVRRALR